MLGIFKRDDGLAAAAGARRSPKWPAWVKSFLQGKVCACCGSRGPLTGHHVIPFHVRPDLELVEGNVRPVCEGQDCHLVIGHLKDWKLWNEDFDRDAAAFLAARKAAIARQRRP